MSKTKVAGKDESEAVPAKVSNMYGNAPCLLSLEDALEGNCFGQCPINACPPSNHDPC